MKKLILKNGQTHSVSHTHKAISCIEQLADIQALISAES